MSKRDPLQYLGRAYSKPVRVIKIDAEKQTIEEFTTTNNYFSEIKEELSLDFFKYECFHYDKEPTPRATFLFVGIDEDTKKKNKPYRIKLGAHQDKLFYSNALLIRIKMPPGDYDKKSYDGLAKILTYRAAVAGADAETLINTTVPVDDVKEIIDFGV